MLGRVFLERFDEFMDRDESLAKYPLGIAKFKMAATKSALKPITAAEKLAEFSNAAKEILDYDDRVEPQRKPNLGQQIGDRKYRNDLNFYIEKMFLYHRTMNCFINAACMDFYDKNAECQKTQKIDSAFIMEFKTYFRAMDNYTYDDKRLRNLNAKRPVIL